MLVKTKGSCRTSTCLWWKNINLTKNNIHITTTETCWSKPRFSLKENMHEDWRNHRKGFTKFNIHTNYTKVHNSNCSRWSRSGCTYAPAPEEQEQNPKQHGSIHDVFASREIWNNAKSEEIISTKWRTSNNSVNQTHWARRKVKGRETLRQSTAHIYCLQMHCTSVTSKKWNTGNASWINCRQLQAQRETENTSRISCAECWRRGKLPTGHKDNTAHG